MEHRAEEPLFQRFDRDGFAHYLTQADPVSNPINWSNFRPAVQGALVASVYLDRRLDVYTDLDSAPDQQLAMALLDEILDRFRPAATWAGFVLELWVRRLDFRLAVER